MIDISFGLRTYCVLLGSYIAACLPFEIIYQLGLFEEKRIQTKNNWTGDLRWKCLSMVAFNFSWLLVVLLCVSPLLGSLFPVAVQLPSALTVVAQLILSFLVDDLFFYTYHRYLHENKELYKLYHKPHHVFKAPFAWTSHAVHPVEMMCQSIGTMTVPLCLGMDQHVYWMWLALRQYQGILDHSGYEGLPFWLDPFSSLATILVKCGVGSVVGGTKFHDDHHHFFDCNYASCFSIIDSIMGTHRSNLTAKRK